MKKATIVAITVSAFLCSPAFAKPKESEKKATVKTEKELQAWAGANPEDVALFEKLLLKIADGCMYLWPSSEALRNRCIKAEMNNFNEALASGELTK